MAVVFQLANLFVMPFWLLMIVLPHWRWTRRILASPLVVAPLPILYFILLFPHLRQILPALANPQLADVARLLGQEEVALIAWVHFLAFDLFVGRWCYLDSRVRGVNAWLMAPVLFLTLLIGPAGLLLYLGVRSLYPAKDAQIVPGQVV